MAIRLHFWGADQTVTGSSHHIECAGQNVLLDCGLFQGRRQQAADINSHLAFTLIISRRQQLAAGGLNAVVLFARAHRPQRRSASAHQAGLSRAYLHHARHHRPPATPMLKDSAHIQESRTTQFLSKQRGRRSSIRHASRPPGARPSALHPGRRRAGLAKQFLPVKLHQPQLLAGSTKDAGLHHDQLQRGPHARLNQCARRRGGERPAHAPAFFRRRWPQEPALIRDPDPAPAADLTSSWRAPTATACTHP